MLLYFKQGIIREEECINKTSCIKSGRMNLSICICLGLAGDRGLQAGGLCWPRGGDTAPSPTLELQGQTRQGCHGLVLQNRVTAKGRRAIPSQPRPFQDSTFPPHLSPHLGLGSACLGSLGSCSVRALAKPSGDPGWRQIRM